MDAAVEFAIASPLPEPSTAHDHVWAEPVNPPEAVAAENKTGGETETLSWLDAVRDAIAEEMRRDENILYFGQVNRLNRTDLPV